MPLIRIGEAAVTPEIAETLTRMQKDDNVDLDGMISDISDLKKFLIHLNGSDEEPATILGHLASIQYIEDALSGLKLITSHTYSNEE